ncbi:MAG TPA: TolC family protein [Gemmatimonadales bacterium]|nr:TolC family protein [Gemmatimonadales bacterium]
MSRRPFATLGRIAGVVLLAGCAHYTPQPLDPPALVEEWRNRTLADTSLLRAVSERAGPPEGGTWTSAQLAVAALLRHPDIAEARALVDAARAGEITAGARPQPGVTGELGRATDPGPFESPWFGSVSVSVRIELGGKRGARIAAARARTARATVDAAAATWAVALRTHEAHAAAIAAESLAASVQGEWTRREAALASARRRLEVGEAAGGDLARLASEQASLEVERVRVEGQRERARQDLARALAIPRAQLGDIVALADRVDGCHATAQASLPELEGRALTQRAEVGGALASYAEAEARLRLEVARTWPDLVLGPGFVWEGGVTRWNLLTSLPELLLNRNRGPIAEATAQREAAGVRVEAAQQAVLADVATARAACAGALRELATADSAVGALAREAAIISAAVERGERGERDRLGMSLVQARAARERQQAAARVAAAGLTLERAVGGWLAEPVPVLDTGGEQTR